MSKEERFKKTLRCGSIIALLTPMQLLATDKPNVIILLVDDVGYSDYGCYGNTVNRTPNIDKLASKGAKFTDFHSNGAVSSPTRAALITGRYQQYSGVEGVVTAASHRHFGLKRDFHTIAKMVKSNGYNTAMYGKWHLGYQPYFNPIHFGFDEFIGYVSGNIDYFTHIDQEGYADWWHNDKLVDEEGYTTDLITDYAVKYIDEKKDEPFFLYLPHEAAHYPFQGPNDKAIRELKDGEFIKHPGREDYKEAYKEMIESFDESLGRVVDAVERAGIADRTLILLMSDNGGSKVSSNAPYSGSKGTLLEGGHRVASIAYWPGVISEGITIDETLMTIDLMPTISEVTGTPIGEGIEYDGASFWNSVVLGHKMPKRTLFWRTSNNVSARSGNWKILINRKTRKGTLVDLDSDKQEKVNLWDKHPDIVEQLLKEIEMWEDGFRDVKQMM